MPASGKTTLGLSLSKRLSMEFVDTDQLFEDKIGMSISQFWENYGEFSFRAIERKIMFECLMSDSRIIASGGGLPLFMDNMYFLNQHKSVYLKVDLEVLSSRIISGDRPVLKNNTLSDLFYKRSPVYEKARYYYDPQESIDSILNNLIK